MNSKDSLLPEPTCAFLRHAFGCFYDAFSQIDLANRPFIHTVAFNETLLSFRSAVLRYAHTIRLLYLKRRFTSLKSKVPPAEARLRFASLVTINALDYKFKLTAAFQKALEARRHRSSSYPPLRPPPHTRRSPANFRQHHTKNTQNKVTTISHRETVGPPPKGTVTTFITTAITRPKNHTFTP